MRSTRQRTLPLPAGLLLAALALYRLAGAPDLWWDEGRTMAAAGNFIESGHFGQVRMGLRLPQGLSGHYPVILLASLGMRLFGVGIWHARLPFALLTLLALAVLFRFAEKEYGRSSAWKRLSREYTLQLTGLRTRATLWLVINRLRRQQNFILPIRSLAARVIIATCIYEGFLKRMGYRFPYEILQLKNV